jgi:cysteine desulfurase/selenocysteine lyase
MLRKELGIVLKIVPLQPNADILLADVKAALSSRTKLVSVAHVSNAFGTVLPVKDIAAAAHEAGAKVLIDGCQAVSHSRVDVQAIDADFYVFSGHKIYGPSGIGVLYGKKALLNAMPPYQTGGDMIASVTFEETIFQEAPTRFEAGTPAIAEVVGLSAALDYVESIGFEAIGAHEKALLDYVTPRLAEIEGVRLVGTAPNKAAIVSFVMDYAHPHDIGTILDDQGVAIRAGHHCAQPAMEALGLMATARASIGLYNTQDDMDALVAAVKKVKEIFG